MAHTPGPWRAVSTEIVSTALPDDDCVVADVLSQDYDHDARLIAAAPELLDALMSAVSILSGWEATSRLDAGDTETVRLCKRAIAKAEGRTHEE